MKRTRRGNQREVDVGSMLEDQGWCVASRRHIAGPGDLLAMDTLTVDRQLLCEVKSTAGGPWERFGPDDRKALIELALKIDAIPCLAWWPPYQKQPAWFRWHPGVELLASWPAWIGPIDSSVSKPTTSASPSSPRVVASRTRRKTTSPGSATSSSTTHGSTGSSVTAAMRRHDWP
jgi:Holliday junction resolvase